MAQRQNSVKSPAIDVETRTIGRFVGKLRRKKSFQNTENNGDKHEEDDKSKKMKIGELPSLPHNPKENLLPTKVPLDPNIQDKMRPEGYIEPSDDLDRPKLQESSSLELGGHMKQGPPISMLNLRSEPPHRSSMEMSRSTSGLSSPEALPTDVNSEKSDMSQNFNAMSPESSLSVSIPQRLDMAFGDLSKSNPSDGREEGYTYEGSSEINNPDSGNGCRSGSLESYYNDLLAKQEHDISRLHEDLEVMKQNKEKMQKQWRQAASDLQKMQAMAHFKLDDKHFISEWKGLIYMIRNWGVQHFSEPQSSRLRGQWASKGQTWKRLVESPENFVRSNNFRPMLVQSLVWERLRSFVFGTEFDEGGVYWSGDMQEQLRDMMKYVRSKERPLTPTEHRDYHLWRSLTTDLIIKKTPKSKFEPKVNKVAWKIFEATKHFTSSPEYKVLEELKEILRIAIELDGEMKKQKASLLTHSYTSPAGKRFGMNFASSVMELEDGQSVEEGTPVTLIISPTLIKVGTLDGRDYDQKTVLVKSTVTCELPRPPSDRSPGDFQDSKYSSKSPSWSVAPASQYGRFPPVSPYSRTNAF